MKYKYPFTKQDGLKNCACACMQMIIKYYKGYINLTQLESLLETNKNGTNAFKITNVFKQLGFNSIGVKLNLDEINKENIVLPAIAHVTINKSYNHYIVIYKIDYKKKKILISDPADKIKLISFEQFDEIWNKVLIIAYPVKPVIKNNEVNLKSIIYYLLKDHKKSIFHLFIMSFIYMVVTIIFSFYLKLLFDLQDTSKSYLFLIFIFFMSIYFLKITTNFLRIKLLIFINQKFDLSVNMDVYKKVINLPYQYYRNRTTGEIISKISDLEKVREFINNLILTLFMDLPLTLISVIVLYLINPVLFFISLIALSLYILVFLLSKNYINSKTETCYKEKASMTSYMYESISGFETVKGLGIENNVIKKYENKYVKYIKEIVKLDNFINIQNYIKELINIISEVVIMYIGIILVTQNKISLGTLLMFNSVSIFFFSPIRNILALDLNYFEAKKVITKVYEMLISSNNKKEVTNIDGDIVINNLSYAYSYENEILKNISLNIKKGEKVVITGKSGSGKSTLLKIIMKYYDIKRNKILIGDNDIKDVDLNENGISYISQNEMLFTDSLYNNINIDNNDSIKFKEVVKICCIDEIIQDNNLGYNMIIEENGFNISGGQKQRIVLGRALLSRCNILLIDEGLNQVDVNLERKILKSIFEKYKNKTIIFISHRLENLDLYDHLIEIEDGKVIKDHLKCMT